MTVAASPPPDAAPRAPRARPRARWILPPAPDPAAVELLARELRLPDVVCRLLLARGHGSADAAKRFLRPRMEQLHDGAQLAGLPEAVDRLARAMRGGETIFVHPYEG